jgi:hypothetical protein
MTAARDRHTPHIWDPTARGVVRCAFQDCQAEPSPEDAAQAIADAEARTRTRIVMDYRRRHA